MGQLASHSSAASAPVVCIGEILIDLIAENDADLLDAQRFAIREGGAPANVAVALARLGVPVGFVGVVGDDPFGHRLRHRLEREDVDVSHLRHASSAETSIAYAWHDERGDGLFRLIRGADALLAPEDIAATDIPEAAGIVVGSVSLATEGSRSAIHRAVEIARDLGIPVVVDVNVRESQWRDSGELGAAVAPLIAAATVLKLSLDDARALWGVDTPEAAMRGMAMTPAPICVLTDGARGMWFASDTHPEMHYSPVLPVEAVEPTGAGDAFTAALVSALIADDWRMTEEAAHVAMAAGALATTRYGAMDALPTRTELDAFLASGKLGSF